MKYHFDIGLTKFDVSRMNRERVDQTRESGGNGAYAVAFLGSFPVYIAAFCTLTSSHYQLFDYCNVN